MPTEDQLNYLVACALTEARRALLLAEMHGRRTDCLNVAVEALNGALRNLIFEDDERARIATQEQEEKNHGK